MRTVRTKRYVSGHVFSVSKDHCAQKKYYRTVPQLRVHWVVHSNYSKVVMISDFRGFGSSSEYHGPENTYLIFITTATKLLRTAVSYSSTAAHGSTVHTWSYTTTSMTDMRNGHLFPSDWGRGGGVMPAITTRNRKLYTRSIPSTSYKIASLDPGNPGGIAAWMEIQPFKVPANNLALIVNIYDGTLWTQPGRSLGRK